MVGGLAAVLSNPEAIQAYVNIALELEGIAKGVWDKLKAKGVTDEQILAIRQDYADRIARSVAEEGTGE